MIPVVILKRRLREGRTYEDFRKAWYHTVGFGSPNKMLTLLNVADPREVIVIGIGLTETTLEQASGFGPIETKERKENPLDDFIEPEIDRTFGILVSEDDFSGSGPIPYRPATVNGRETDMTEVAKNLSEVAKLLAQLQRKTE
jgi:hypothetical protein